MGTEVAQLKISPEFKGLLLGESSGITFGYNHRFGEGLGQLQAHRSNLGVVKSQNRNPGQPTGLGGKGRKKIDDQIGFEFPDCSVYMKIISEKGKNLTQARGNISAGTNKLHTGFFQEFQGHLLVADRYQDPMALLLQVPDYPPEVVEFSRMTDVEEISHSQISISKSSRVKVEVKDKKHINISYILMDIAAFFFFFFTLIFAFNSISFLIQ